VGNYVAVLLQIYFSIYMLKIIKIKCSLTKLLQKIKGCIFLSHSVVIVEFVSKKRFCMLIMCTDYGKRGYICGVAGGQDGSNQKISSQGSDTGWCWNQRQACCLLLRPGMHSPSVRYSNILSVRLSVCLSVCHVRCCTETA